LSASTAPSEYLYKSILVLFGSPHKNGHTAKLLGKYLSRLPADADIYTFYCYDEKIAPCFGCNICKSGICVYDDLDNLREQLENSDLLIIATPVYNLSFPAPLKTVLDRFQIYWAQRFLANIKPPVKKPRDAWILGTCGSEKNDGAEIINRQLDMLFTVMNTKKTLSVFQNGTDNK